MSTSSQKLDQPHHLSFTNENREMTVYQRLVSEWLDDLHKENSNRSFVQGKCTVHNTIDVCIVHKKKHLELGRLGSRTLKEFSLPISPVQGKCTVYNTIDV